MEVKRKCQEYEISLYICTSWETYRSRTKKSHWFISHTTVCYRKSAALDAENYNENLKQMCLDFVLESHILKTHGYIYNFQEALLHYRLHDKQITYNGGEGERDKWHSIRVNIILS